jgi:hypothetical protein
LDHLLLVKRIDFSAQDDAAWNAFQKDFAAKSMRVGLDRAIDAVQQRRAIHGCGSEWLEGRESRRNMPQNLHDANKMRSKFAYCLGSKSVYELLAVGIEPKSIQFAAGGTNLG